MSNEDDPFWPLEISQPLPSCRDDWDELFDHFLEFVRAELTQLLQNIRSQRLPSLPSWHPARAFGHRQVMRLTRTAELLQLPD
eukprot:CAMPEP_0197708194 /NCGR_PEP_ID=MMETSP1338-20131121/127833_1 /TAXON_ID=43686 ORGANISM="Pelagodinium beii, Strain RCC1491" /NCGR_SAMPLE_ID=MMETSP1338 /ASSEMBLY_ACC=CAM_ASM_000754 /LENGTH=82 /DNA_ID=CAMNT_0043292123 /DNA_START=788 /DNA_END=1033 /DNA_ORIENTATION=+